MTQQTKAALLAISPLDGRYEPKMGALKNIVSEFGFFKYRIQIELLWLKSLAENQKITNIEPLTKERENALLNLITGFDVTEALKIKAIEAVTRHDLKAVENYLRAECEHQPLLAPYIEYIHFACTSEDINNLAYALMVKTARDEVLLPLLQNVEQALQKNAHLYADVPMLSLTHGQSATPTTVGKEFAVFAYRLKRQIQTLRDIEILGKINGAVGNYNAHHIAYPDVVWEKHAEQFVTSLGLTFNPYTTQIEPHDGLAELFDCLRRINVILIDAARDLWGYISRGVFKQPAKAGEVGSSTMPHKVNPIDFENAEGNLGVANALFTHFSEKLPISRWQRDLSDSTVLRNMGSGFAYSLIAYEGFLLGLSKLDLNISFLQAELNQNWQVLTEAIQTVMRRFGIEAPYEKLKAIAHGQQLSKADIHHFINTLDIPADAKTALLNLTPEHYLGIAVELARKI